MRLVRTLGGALPLALFVLSVSGQGIAAPSANNDAPGLAQRSIIDVGREATGVQRIIANARASERTPEQRLANGELLLQSHDYPRAIIALSEVLERYPNHPTVYPDALSMLGEAYYQSQQILSARRAFRQIADRSNESRMVSFVPRAFGRLVDIALRRQDYAELDEILAKMSAWPSDATVQYARAKGLLAKKDFSGSRAALNAVPPGHPLYPQAKYVAAVVTMREVQAQVPNLKQAPGEVPPPAPPTRYAAAIEAFRQVTVLAPDTPEHQHVEDLAWLAIGRLFYEADQWLEAADAYNHVDRQSPEFGTSLYELAWVYVRLGDTDRATRALEVLSVADPQNAYLADGTLLRADLMLRSGQFDKALSIYQTVRAEYDPMRERVDGFLGSTNDPAIYYDKLSQEQLDTTGSATTQLPPMAIQWAREEQDGPAAFSVLDDVTQCRVLLHQSQILVSKLRVILNAPNRVRAFPDLKAGDEKLVQLLNRITLARGTLAQGLDEVEPAEVSGELAQVRRERRDLQKRLQLMPISDSDFAAREASAQRQWNAISQRLQQVQLEVDQLQAIVNGLKRMIIERPVAGISRDPATIQQWQAELAANERDLKTYRDQIDQVRLQIETGKVQVGYGDQRFVEDEEVRAAFRDKLNQEARLVASGGAGANASAYANRITSVLSQADETESKLFGARREIDAEVTKKAAEVTRVIEQEATSIATYAGRLDSLDQEARFVVGQVAMRNFNLVRNKLRNIVLRADVGTVEQAWEVREEQVTRVRNLQVERVREEQILREELREVLDDATDATTPNTPSPSP